MTLCCMSNRLMCVCVLHCNVKIKSLPHMRLSLCVSGCPVSFSLGSLLMFGRQLSEGRDTLVSAGFLVLLIARSDNREPQQLEGRLHTYLCPRIFGRLWRKFKEAIFFTSCLHSHITTVYHSIVHL